MVAVRQDSVVMEFSLPTALFVATAFTTIYQYRHSKCALNCPTTAYSCNPSKDDIANVFAWSVCAGRNFQILKEQASCTGHCRLSLARS